MSVSDGDYSGLGRQELQQDHHHRHSGEHDPTDCGTSNMAALL